MSDSLDAETLTIEEPEDAGKGREGVVTRWLRAISLSSGHEKDWRKSGEKVIRRFRQEGEDFDPAKLGKNPKFNILWSNTEVMRPALYHSTPKPDVRRRYRSDDPIGKEASLIVERALSYSVDAYDFDQTMNLAVLDLLLPGRCVTRVRYKPTFGMVQPPPVMPEPIGQDPMTGAQIFAPDVMRDEMGQPMPIPQEPYEAITYQEATCEHVKWDDFRRGPGDTWDDVEWIAFRHKLTRKQLRDINKRAASKVEMDFEIKDKKDDGESEDEPEIFKRAIVWEVWDKEKREVLFIAPSYKDGPLKVEKDPLNLKDFFPIPRPIYALETTDTLVPVELFKLYKDQADELDRITARINSLTKGLRLRGIYDSTIKNMGQLMSSGDNTMLPAGDSMLALLQNGSFDKAIWMMPINVAAAVLKELYAQRETIKQTIYEITGLSDIIRGATDPGETLGAQQLKAQSGSRRLRRMQKEVQRYARDLFRLKSEIICEHFEPEILAQIVGKDQIHPQVIDLLREDFPRNYRIDIETDSTIAEDEQRDQESLAKLLDGITRYIAAVGPIVQAGYMPPKGATALMKTIVRKFRLGREVEDAIEEAEATIEKTGGQMPPDPEQEAMKAQAEAKKQEAVMAQQMAMAEDQRKQAAAEAEEIRKQQAFEREEMRKQQAFDLEQQRIEREARAKVYHLEQTTQAQIQAAKAKAAAQTKAEKKAA